MSTVDEVRASVQARELARLHAENETQRQQLEALRRVGGMMAVHLLAVVDTYPAAEEAISAWLLVSPAPRVIKPTTMGDV